MRVVIATCSVAYEGRLSAYLPLAPRLLMVKADGSVSIHADDRAYKPLNWMSPPCELRERPGSWLVSNPKGETLSITIESVHADVSYELGAGARLEKDGVEAELQQLLAARPDVLGDGFRLIRREYPTDIGPVDLLCRDGSGGVVAVEVKRRGEIDGVEQLGRYLERLEQDGRWRPVRGVLAAQHIRPQAKVLASARGIRCVEVDYDALRRAKPSDLTLF
jgi:RecB family endonuclease NucS